MSSAVSGIVVGQCRIIMAASGCKVCGVEFSDAWHEQKLPIVIAGKRQFISVPICAGCAPHHSAIENQNSRFENPVPAEVGHL